MSEKIRYWAPISSSTRSSLFTIPDFSTKGSQMMHRLWMGYCFRFSKAASPCRFWSVHKRRSSIGSFLFRRNPEVPPLSAYSTKPLGRNPGSCQSSRGPAPTPPAAVKGLSIRVPVYHISRQMSASPGEKLEGRPPVDFRRHDKPRRLWYTEHKERMSVMGAKSRGGPRPYSSRGITVPSR